MTRLLLIARCALLLVLTAGTSLIAYDLHGTLRASQANLAQLHTTVENANAAIVELRTAATNEQRYYDQGARQMAGSFKALRLLVDRTDKSLNDANGTFAQMDRAITNFDEDAEQLTRQADSSIAQTSASASGALDNIGRSASSLDSLLASPHIASSLANIDSISGHLNVIGANSDAMSSDMRLAVHRLAKPPSKWHTVLDMSYTSMKFGSLFIP